MLRAKAWGAPLLLLLGLAPLTLGGGTPAQAAQPNTVYTIYASGFAPAYPTALTFVLSGCSVNQMNGIDSYALDVSAYAPRGALTISWSSPAVAPAASSLASQYYDAACQRIPRFGNSSTTPGLWGQTVPPNAKWLLVSATGTADVTFTVS